MFQVAPNALIASDPIKSPTIRRYRSSLLHDRKITRCSWRKRVSSLYAFRFSFIELNVEPKAHSLARSRVIHLVK